MDEIFPDTKDPSWEHRKVMDDAFGPMNGYNELGPGEEGDSAPEGEQESDASEGGQESDGPSNEGDSQPSEGQPSKPEQPSEPSPDTSSRPKGISNIVKGFDAVQEREAKLNKNFNNLNKKLDSFSQGVENGDIKVSKRQAKKFATDVEAVSTAANGTRLANRNMRSSMTALTKTQNELDEAQKGIDTLTDSANQSPLDKEQKKELRDLKKQSSQLKKTRSKQAKTARERVGQAKKAQTALNNSFKGARSSMNDIRDNPPGRLESARDAMDDIANKAKQLAGDPIVQAALVGGTAAAASIATIVASGDEKNELLETLDMIDDLIDKQLLENGDISPVLNSLDIYLENYSQK